MKLLLPHKFPPEVRFTTPGRMPPCLPRNISRPLPQKRKEAGIFSPARKRWANDYATPDSNIPAWLLSALTAVSERTGLLTAMIYQRSFIDRKLISKILSSEDYHPSKQTVFALCIALRLNLEESREFLSLAGYTFSHHKKYDLIIEFLLDNQIYNIDAVNEILFHFTEPCFGE